MDTVHKIYFLFPTLEQITDNFTKTFILTGTRISNGLAIEEKSSWSLEVLRRKLCRKNQIHEILLLLIYLLMCQKFNPIISWAQQYQPNLSSP